MEGISKTRLYTIFSGMKQRCYNQNCDAYRFYGAKGIAICDEWMGEHGLFLFMEWALNNGYEENLTIDRIDSKGPYSPDNCRWVTQSENSSRVKHQPSLVVPLDKHTATASIKRRLQDIGMTQMQLAEALGTNRQNLGNKLRRDNFSAQELATICKILGLKLTMVENDPGKYIIEYETDKK